VGGIERRGGHKEKRVIGIHKNGHDGENRIYMPSADMRMQHVVEVGIIIDENSLLVYCNGSCVCNGSSRARAAIGIYFGPNHPHNRGETICDPLINTTQTAELIAFEQGLAYGITAAEDTQLTKLVIVSDSEYVCRWLYQ